MGKKRIFRGIWALIVGGTGFFIVFLFLGDTWGKYRYYPIDYFILTATVAALTTLVAWGLRELLQGRRMKPFTELTDGDFPGVDHQKFYDWYFARRKVAKVGAIGAWIGFVLFLLAGRTLIRRAVMGAGARTDFSFELFSILILLFLICWGSYQLTLWAKAKKFQREAGIDPEAIQRALENVHPVSRHRVIT